jgi:hypothetical protein
MMHFYAVRIGDGRFGICLAIKASRRDARSLAGSPTSKVSMLASGAILVGYWLIRHVWDFHQRFWPHRFPAPLGLPMASAYFLSTIVTTAFHVLFVTWLTMPFSEGVWHLGRGESD